MHFVIGAEYQKQDPASLPVLRSRVVLRELGPYQTLDHCGLRIRLGRHCDQQRRSRPDHATPAPMAYSHPIGFSAATFSLRHRIRQPLYSGAPDGLGLTAVRGNNDPYSGTGPGGDGELVNTYTNLVTSVKRGIITGLITAKITDSINMNLDLNWGKVNAFNPLSNFQIQSGTAGLR